MPNKYESVKKFNLFKENKEEGSKKPDFKNGNVQLEVSLPAGKYSVAAWQYEDTGNISLDIQRVTEDNTFGGFDD